MKKNLLQILYPPASWRLPVIVLMGALTGLGIYTFYISKAWSYLGDDPKTCVNCHIMAPQYATWMHSSHREKTNCMDCHVPHNNVLNKYFFKAKDGMRHATLFTLRMEPQVIFIKEEGAEVVQQNCIRCHDRQVADAKFKVMRPEFHSNLEGRKCVSCHRYTPHGRVNSLSSVPYARVPLPQSPVPEWIQQYIRK